MSEKRSAVTAPGVPPSDPSPRITPREKEILCLIAEGLTDRQIAQRLWISRSTVHTHLVHLREKLQVHNRVALVREAERRGFLVPQKSTVLWIGEGEHLGYTPGQETALKPFPEQTGGEAAADEEGETEMLNPKLRFWLLAALLALVAENGSAAERAPRARAVRAPATSAAVDANEKIDGLADRRVWAGQDVDACGAPSPDGRYLSFVDWETGDLAIRDLATGKSRRLTNKGPWHVSDEFAIFSTMSPDGKQVAYAWCNKDWFHDLRLIGRDGSQPRILYRNAELKHIRPDAWSKDGKQILAVFFRQDGANQIVLVSVADGSARVLKAMGRKHPKKMSLSPDGRSIVYDYPAQAEASERDLFLLAADGSRDAPLVQHPGNDTYPLWAPDGQRILFVSDRTGTLGAWMMRVADGKVQGAPELVKRGMGALVPLGFARDGSLHYALQAGIVDVYTATLDPATGQVLAAPEPINRRLLGASTSPAWSPDGGYLAYLSRERNSLVAVPRSRIVAIRSVESGETRELALELDYIYQPSWSPDGRSLLAGGRDHEQRGGIFRIDAQTGALTMLAPSGGGPAPPVWARDGRSIFYLTGGCIRARDLETGQEKELYRGRAYKFLALSPDGRQLAFFTEERGTPTYVIRVIPATGGEPRELLRVNGPEGLTLFAWTPDGRHLLIGRRNAPDSDPLAEATEVWRIPAAGGDPQRLGLAMNELRELRVHPDGRRVAFTAGASETEIWVLENFLPPAQTAQASAPRR